MRSTSAVLAVLFLIFSVNASLAVTNYTRLSHGLVSNVITTIEMDPSGSLWVGTDTGVSRFNGLEWKNYRYTNAGFPTEYINDIMPDNNGLIYFCTTGGVTVYDSPTWDNPKMTLPNPDVESAIMDGNEDIWFGTGGGLAKYTNFDIKDLYKMSNSDIPSDFVKEVEIDSFQLFWLATGTGVSKFDGHVFTNYSTLQGLPDDNIKSIAIENGPVDDIVWVATANGVGKRVGSIWTTLTTFNGLLDNDVRHVMVDYQNNKWFSTTTKGVCVLTGSATWVDYTVSNGNLVDDRATTASVDNSENVWIGTEGGLTKVGDNAIVSFNKILYLNPEALAYVTVNDPLMNADSMTAETLLVHVYSATDPLGINLTLMETDVNTGIFSSNRSGEELGFSYTGSDEPTRKILVSKGDQIFASYSEADVAATRTAIAYYNEEAPFSDDLFLDPPCFIATASYKDSSYFDRFKGMLIDLAEAFKQNP